MTGKDRNDTEHSQDGQHGRKTGNHLYLRANEKKLTFFLYVGNGLDKKGLGGEIVPSLLSQFSWN